MKPLILFLILFLALAGMGTIWFITNKAKAPKCVIVNGNLNFKKTNGSLVADKNADLNGYNYIQNGVDSTCELSKCNTGYSFIDDKDGGWCSLSSITGCTYADQKPGDTYTGTYLDTNAEWKTYYTKPKNDGDDPGKYCMWDGNCLNNFTRDDTICKDVKPAVQCTDRKDPDQGKWQWDGNKCVLTQNNCFANSGVKQYTLAEDAQSCTLSCVPPSGDVHIYDDSCNQTNKCDTSKRDSHGLLYTNACDLDCNDTQTINYYLLNGHPTDSSEHGFSAQLSQNICVPNKGASWWGGCSPRCDTNSTITDCQYALNDKDNPTQCALTKQSDSAKFSDGTVDGYRKPDTSTPGCLQCPPSTCAPWVSAAAENWKDGCIGLETGCEYFQALNGTDLISGIDSCVLSKTDIPSGILFSDTITNDLIDMVGNRTTTGRKLISPCPPNYGLCRQGTKFKSGDYNSVITSQTAAFCVHEPITGPWIQDLEDKSGPTNNTVGFSDAREYLNPTQPFINGLSYGLKYHAGGAGMYDSPFFYSYIKTPLTTQVPGGLPIITNYIPKSEFIKDSDGADYCTFEKHDTSKVRYKIYDSIGLILHGTGPNNGNLIKFDTDTGNIPMSIFEYDPVELTITIPSIPKLTLKSDGPYLSSDTLDSTDLKHRWVITDETIDGFRRILLASNLSQALQSKNTPPSSAASVASYEHLDWGFSKLKLVQQ